jgi:hypothetical protein
MGENRRRERARFFTLLFEQDVAGKEKENSKGLVADSDYCRNSGDNRLDI